MELMGVDFRITCQSDDFRSFTGVKLVYASYNPFSDVPWMYSMGLLNETGIHQGNPVHPGYNDGIPVIFPCYDKNSIVPFDLFSSVFFLISRYEEYLPYTPDQHGRFEAGSSQLFQSGFIKRPLINEWTVILMSKLSNIYPGFNPPGKKFRFQLTFDIDSAWAYKNRGFIRNLGGYLNSLNRLAFKEITDRTLALSSLRIDPFDNFQWIENICNQYTTLPIYFFLVGKFSKYNKNTSPGNGRFRELVKQTSKNAVIGIHPSYETPDNPALFKNEIKTLSEITGTAVTKSRQHFLRMNLPYTYRTLISEGITEDYTMGFAGTTGYRAGTCTPYNFYDLPCEMETRLRIFPLSVMEGTLKDYLQLSNYEAIEEISKIINQIKSVNGTFIPLWHNESLSDAGSWKGWRMVFEEMMRMVTGST